MRAGKGSFYPSQISADIYKRLLEHVVVAVNLLHMAWRESGGTKGVDPAKNYNMVYDKRMGTVFVEFWHGDKYTARAFNKVERFTVSEVCDNATSNTGGEFERFVRKEVII